MDIDQAPGPAGLLPRRVASRRGACVPWNRKGAHRMIRVVSWNIAKWTAPWRELAEMARRGEADVALLQETGNPPGDLARPFRYENDIGWDRSLCDRWPLVVQLSDRVEMEWFRQAPPKSGGFGVREVGVSGIGTMAAARVAPRGRPREAFVAVSMYAAWIKANPSTGKNPGIASDVSAHRILSDLSTFIDYEDPSRHRILAAGDLNMFHGATGRRLSWVERERTVWDRFEALGLAFLGPQTPNGRPAASPQPDVPADTRNVPTYRTARQSPGEANRQLDYVFASRGFHEKITVRALNDVDEWGSSDHCRLLIEIADG
ncbi:MAG: endonuclease/exonuclease/phosphatase family protein [Defluviicoccus sp.]|nr:endonuclease/exonuclease/phosphatase family protein [Defluviicoccus sp.]MDE0274568.1 endonuclease/exonuclease/phosphatase family protein [Defluviicoccus sp.]